MRILLRVEELAQFLFILALMIVWQQGLGFGWWWYVLLVLGPDISMLGYLLGPRVGAIAYNIFHHKAVAILVFMTGFLVMREPPVGQFSTPQVYWMLVGMVLYGHASMDRIFGYGLKFGDSFHHTHLGWIGKGAERRSTEV